MHARCTLSLGRKTIRMSHIYANRRWILDGTPHFQITNYRCTLAGTLQPPGWRPPSFSTLATTCSIEPAMKLVWIFGPFLWSQHFYRNYISLLFFNISPNMFLNSINCSHQRWLFSGVSTRWSKSAPSFLDNKSFTVNFLFIPCPIVSHVYIYQMKM